MSWLYNYYMKTEIKDPLNIKNEVIHDNPIRVKMFILNEKNEYILIPAFEGYQLPGGHVEGNEDFKLAVIREVQEDTGIMLDENEVPVPFFRIERYSKKSDGTNRCATIIYYFIKTDKRHDLSKRNLTEHEKENNYSVCLIHKDNVEQELTKVINTSPNEGSRIVADETLYAFKILKKEIFE